MTRRTFFADGCGFFVESEGKIVAVCWMGDKTIAAKSDSWHSIESSDFRARLRAQGWSDQPLKRPRWGGEVLG